VGTELLGVDDGAVDVVVAGVAGVVDEDCVGVVAGVVDAADEGSDDGVAEAAGFGRHLCLAAHF
jgi:hypothetical protein